MSSTAWIVSGKRCHWFKESIASEGGGNYEEALVYSYRVL